MTLALTVSHPAFFAVRGIGEAELEIGFQCRCAKCGRDDITCPNDFVNELVWCLYCGFEHGYVAPVELQTWGRRYFNGVTLEEARAENAALDDSVEALEELCDQRARALGHILDFFDR